MDPADLIYKPGSFSRMREQVRDAHDKMDRHRQLLDRYLTDSGPTRDIQGSVQRKMEELERRDPYVPITSLPVYVLTKVTSLAVLFHVKFRYNL